MPTGHASAVSRAELAWVRSLALYADWHTDLLTYLLTYLLTCLFKKIITTIIILVILITINISKSFYRVVFLSFSPLDA